MSDHVVSIDSMRPAPLASRAPLPIIARTPPTRSLSDAWMSRNQHDVWPGEPALESDVTDLCEGCDERVPLHDLYWDWHGGPRGQSRRDVCLDCWIQSRAREAAGVSDV